MPVLTCRDDFARYVIECPPGTTVTQDGDRDVLVVPDPTEPEVPFWLFDDILLEAARSEDFFGLRLVSLTPIN